MKNEGKQITRRKLVGWMGLFSVSTLIGAGFWSQKRKQTNTTIKMLTEDGRLVEIDASLLAENKQKISDKELQNWIKNK